MSAEVMIWNPTERLLWGLTVAFLLINAMIYFSRSKEKKVVKECLIFLGLGCLFLFGAVSRLAHFYADLAIPRVFKDKIQIVTVKHVKRLMRFWFKQVYSYLLLNFLDLNPSSIGLL